MMLVVAIMAVIVAWVRPAWPDRAGIGHSIVAGLLVQGLYLAGTVFAVAHEVPVGLSALIPGLQPILTSILASRFLGERVTPLQWGGVALGLAGVLLILHGRPMTGEAGWGWFASAISLITITVGTLYQKRYCGGIDWRTGSFIQQLAAMVMLGIGAWALETNVIHWSAEFVLSVVWLAVVLSIGTVGLLYWLLRRQASSQVASLFYLVPAVTALMAFVLFGEKLDAVAIIGMIACGAAVLLVNRARA
jgi:drug/metabolite transporter (DMT)-like permease